MILEDSKFPLVAVTWDDAETDTGWDDPPKKLEEKLALTVGFLIKRTARHLLIASTIDKEKSTNGRIQIPRGMVKQIVTLKEKAP